MGVALTPIVPRQTVALADLAGRRFAVDAAITLYQFLSIVRGRNGSSLSDTRGRVTSHLVGLLSRSTRLIADHGIELVYVFDGAPPPFKREALAARREVRQRAEREREAALAAGDLATAFSKAVSATRLNKEMIRDAQTLLDLLGIPWMEAPSEGEAQAAYLAAQGDVWAAESKDFDSLLFGAPRLVRFLAIGSREFLPSQGRSRAVEPELIELERLLAAVHLTREQLVDAALLIGTDFTPGVKGVGPKRAVRLLAAHGSIESLPADVRDQLPSHWEEVRRFFLDPPVAPPPSLERERPDVEGVRRFLIEERGFSAARVDDALRRLERPPTAERLDRWL